jgi:hypothetical protein
MTARQRLACMVVLLTAGLALTGCGGGSGSGSTTPPPSGDFSITVNPASVSIVQGAQSSPINVSVGSVHGLTGNVSVAIVGLPVGVTSSPASPLSVAVGSSVAVTLAATKAASLGPASLSFQGTDGSLSHSASSSLAIGAAPDFGLAVQPGTVSVKQGASQTVSFLVSPLNGFTGNVAVSLTGVPKGITVTPGSSFTAVAGVASSLTFTASSSASAGTASLAFQGVAGSTSHVVDASMQVVSSVAPDFSIAVAPGVVAMTQGTTSGPVSIGVSGLNGFSGDITVAISGLPAGVTASPTSVKVLAGSTGTVTFTAAITAKPISANVAFQGSNGTVTHTTDAFVEVMSDAVFSTTYFFAADTDGAADETVNILNPGIQSTASTTGTLCANIYVFDQSQELKECCSCPITANGLLTLSVNGDLTANSGNGLPFANGAGTIDVVPGSIPSTGYCDASNVTSAPDLNVWATHVAYGVSDGDATLPIVESPASDLTLAGSALTDFVTYCGFIETNDSGTGICSCGSGSDESAARRLSAKK